MAYLQLEGRQHFVPKKTLAKRPLYDLSEKNNTRCPFSAWLSLLASVIVTKDWVNLPTAATFIFCRVTRVWLCPLHLDHNPGQQEIIQFI